jgi:hypothetical protein
MQGCYRDLNLEAATWEPGSLVRYRFSLERDFPARAFKAAFISRTPLLEIGENWAAYESQLLPAYH